MLLLLILSASQLKLSALLSNVFDNFMKDHNGNNSCVFILLNTSCWLLLFNKVLNQSINQLLNQSINQCAFPRNKSNIVSYCTY